MQVIDTHHFILSAGEEVTVVVDEVNTAFAVGYAINGVPGAMQDNIPLTFKAIRSPTFFTLTGVFSGSSAGRYDVQISGSNGKSSTDRLDQVGGSAIDIHEYEFRIV